MATMNFDATAYPQEKQKERVWSPYQNGLFNFVQNELGNALVQAVAGSGKTTTIVEAMERVQGSCIFLAFNKSIAEELKARGVNARTFHSLTYSVVTRHYGIRQIADDKLGSLMKMNMKGDEVIMYGSFIKRLVGLGKNCGIGCLIPDITDSWMNIVIHHDMELDNEAADLGRALELASDLLGWSNTSPSLDFDDLLYRAVKEGLLLQKFDFVFVDEAQDTNAIQRALLRKIMHPGSRLVAVGDEGQAIYGFRGSDSNSMNLIAEEFNCKRLPLTVSYRCPVEVVKYAQQWVSHIEAAPDAPDGVVTKLGHKWEYEVFSANDLVVCRTTKPLIALAIQFMKRHIPFYILGKDLAASLTSLITRLKPKDLQDLERRLELWMDREVEKAIAKQEDSKAEAVQDRVEALLCLINSLPEGAQVSNLYDLIKSLFTDTMNSVKLATIHKSKGLEADRVFWLNRDACPAPWARQPWQKQQEVNLCYVACTRAKKELFTFEM